jgi:uncharacterized protein
MTDERANEAAKMSQAFTRLCFLAVVKGARAGHGARERGRLLENKKAANSQLNDDLEAFSGTTTSFFIGTANRGGCPPVQHCGGSAGFLKILDDRTLAFAGYIGDRQYTTVGNLTENGRFLLYERGRWLKTWRRGTAVDNEPALIERVRDRTYPAKTERVIRIDVKACGLNCSQCVPKSQQLLDQSIADCDARVVMLPHE